MSNIYKPGEFVRLSDVALQSEWAVASVEHVEEFKRSVGEVIGLAQWPGSSEPGPEYRVCWYFSSRCGVTRLYYTYPPEFLTSVEPTSINKDWTYK